jgi:hypothetical protein
VRIRSSAFSTLCSPLKFDPPHPTTPFDETVGLGIPFPSILEPNHPDSSLIHSSESEGPPATGSTRKRGNQSVGRAAKRRRMTTQISERVPEDLLTPIFEQLQDQRDLYACSLVSRTFNRAVTPILYRSWDTRVLVDLHANDRFARSHKVFQCPLWCCSGILNEICQIFDPVQTFLQTPELLQYVRHAQAAGRSSSPRNCGRGSDDSYLGSIHKFGTWLFDNLLTALRKCEHLESFTWTEQADRLTTQPHEDPMAHSVADQSLRGVTKVLRELPITDLTIRSYGGLSEEAWSELIKINRLKRLSLWCMEGQPRVLQGWSETLGATLTHLELGVRGV